MSVIDEYLDKLELSRRPQLERLRKLARQVAPEAEEVISYGMPAFKYRGVYLVGINASTNHYGLYPTPGPIEALKERLGEYKTAKGTVQFTDDNPLPEALVKEIIHWRMAEIEKM